MKKIVFLYSELAGYTVACLKALAKHDVEIHVFRWPVNKEAPFKFDFPESVKVYNKPDTRDELKEQLEKIKPDVIYSSGWMDKDYVALCKAHRSRIPVIVGFDNQWEGRFRQRIAQFLSKRLVHKRFSYAWVPGVRQKEYARRLGFDEDHILDGLYSADTDLYDKYYRGAIERKKEEFPKRFVYVGRYIEQKGINELWEAWRLFRSGHPEWELWCVGTGELYDERPEMEGLVHKGFVQPTDFQQIINDTGVFILPSHFEPWGVVLHEFAMAGYPLISTQQSGASTEFVRHDHNGYLFDAGNAYSLVEKMNLIADKSSEDLINMGEQSRALAKGITPDLWADQIMRVI